MKSLMYSLMVLTSLFVVIPATSQTDGNIVNKQVDDLMNDAIGKGMFSGVVIITKDGKQVYKKESGYADWDTKRPVADNTLYNIGSLNKQFTEEIIHQLVKERKLEYMASLSKYLNLLPAETGNKITIEQLLEMRSGLGDYFASPEFAKIERTDFQLNDILDIIKNEPLWFEPGTDRRYSNSGYVVLGAVIEKVTGKSYEENLKERIAAPLQFENIYYTKAEKAAQPNRAFGNTINFDGKKIGVDDISNSHPDGGAYTTFAELLTFTEAKRTHTLPSGYDYKPATFAGGTPPWNANIHYDNDGYSFVVMCNIGESADALGMRINSILKGERFRPLSYPFGVTLYKELSEKGISYIEQNIKELCEQGGRPYGPRFLNFYGYQFLNGGRTDLAIQLFTLNVTLFPKNSNTYDSLAEAYLKNGDKINARKYYNQALELDPGNDRIKNLIKDIGN